MINVHLLRPKLVTEVWNKLKTILSFIRKSFDWFLFLVLDDLASTGFAVVCGVIINHQKYYDRLVKAS